MLAALATQRVEVLEEGLPLWSLWQSVATQWRYAGMGSVAGLDYVAVDLAAKWTGFEVTKWAFQTLRRMEAAALEIWQQKDG